MLIINMEFQQAVLFLLFLVGGFMTTYFLIPPVINVVRIKKLYEKRNERSSHQLPTPSFGGVSIYLPILLALSLAAHFYTDLTAAYIIAGTSILFFVGLKDDLTGIKPIHKLIAQLIAAAILFLSPTFQISDLNGWLGMHQLNPFLLFPLAFIVVAFFVNAFNLIDGIDGLAGGLGIFFSSGFALLFYQLSDWLMVAVNLTIIGSLIAFLRFNLSVQRKIFLGDTGSLLLGFFYVLCVLMLMAREELVLMNVRAQNLPYVLIGLLFIPVVDSLRVFFVRIKEKRSPFSADRNHIHHVVLDQFSLSHVQTSCLLVVFNAVVFVLLYLSARMFSQAIVASELILLIIATTSFLTKMRNKRDASL